jgi:TPR repeat protein
MNYLNFSEVELSQLKIKSENGCAGSTLTLAEYYRSLGESLENIERYYVLSINQGSVIAASALANFYETELMDDAKAFHWYRVACDADDSLACIRLALAYKNGDLQLPEDSKLAKKYSDRASEIEARRL